MKIFHLAALATSVGASGCLVLFHDPDGGGGAAPAGSATESAPATSTGSGGGECAAACVDAAPEGWLGPISLRDGASCSADEALAKTVGLDATERGACTCAPNVAPCAPPEVNLYTVTTCTSTPTQATAGYLDCTLGSNADNLKSFKIAQIPSYVPEVTCVAAEAQTPPVVDFTAPHSLCSRGGTCPSGKSCVSSGDICVYASGNGPACPDASAYRMPRASLLEVASSSCTCGARPHGSCAGELLAGSDASCTGADSKMIEGTDLTCQQVSFSPKYLRYDPTAEPQCDMGAWEAEPTPIRVCCLE